MVLADSYRVSRAPYYLGYSWGSETFAYRTVTVYGGSFQNSSANLIPSRAESRYPNMTYVILVWAVPRSLAATKGITVLFYFLPGTKMFQFPDLPCPTLYIQVGIADILGGVAPFGDLRI
jgi:hypothetical protein